MPPPPHHGGHGEVAPVEMPTGELVDSLLMLDRSGAGGGIPVSADGEQRKHSDSTSAALDQGDGPSIVYAGMHVQNIQKQRHHPQRPHQSVTMPMSGPNVAVWGERPYSMAPEAGVLPSVPPSASVAIAAAALGVAPSEITQGSSSASAASALTLSAPASPVSTSESKAESSDGHSDKGDGDGEGGAEGTKGEGGAGSGDEGGGEAEDGEGAGVTKEGAASATEEGKEGSKESKESVDQKDHSGDGVVALEQSPRSNEDLRKELEMR